MSCQLYEHYAQVHKIKRIRITLLCHKNDCPI